MVEKSTEKSQFKSDYKFWTIVLLLVFIACVQVVSLHKINKILCRERWANRIDKVIYNSTPMREHKRAHEGSMKDQPQDINSSNKMMPKKDTK